MCSRDIGCSTVSRGFAPPGSSRRPRKTWAELNRKLAHGGRPLGASPPAPSGISDGEVKQLQCGIVVGEAAARLDDLAQRPMQRLDGIGGVDHLADAGCKRE